MYNISLTTKADQRHARHRTPQVKWTTQPLKDEGFGVHFPSKEEEPFRVLKDLGTGGHGSVQWCQSRDWSRGRGQL